VPKDK